MLDIKFIRISDFDMWSCTCIVTGQIVGYSNRLPYITHNINGVKMVQPIRCVIDDAFQFLN